MIQVIHVVQVIQVVQVIIVVKMFKMAQHIQNTHDNHGVHYHLSHHPTHQQHHHPVHRSLFSDGYSRHFTMLLLVLLIVFGTVTMVGKIRLCFFSIAKAWLGHKHCDHVKQACNVIDNILQMQICKTIIHKV